MEVVIEFLESLASKSVKLSATDGQLNCYAPKGTLTADIKDGIARYKSEIVALLQEAEKAPRPRQVDQSTEGRPREFPLTAGEKGLYILQRLRPEMSAYNVPVCFKIRGELKVPLLARAWELVLEQYPILTARVIEKDGELRHLLDDGCKTSLRTQAMDIANEEQLVAFLRQRAKEPFDLNRGPLTRIELFVRDEQEWILLLTIHHIVFDGTSGMILLKTFLAFYQQLCKGKEVWLSPDPVGYHEFTAWEEAMLASREGHAHADYWERQLSGELPIVELLPDLPRQDAPGFEGETLVADLPQELGHWAREFGKAHALPPSVIFLAAFQLLLHKYTGQEDIIVGMPVMGRAAQKFANEIGYFINMVPLRTHCGGQLSLLEFLRQVRAIMMDALYHSSYPFPLMLEKLKFAKKRKNPVFQVIFAYQNFVDESSFTPLLQGLVFENVHGVVQEGESDFGLEIYERPASFQLYLKYNPESYTEDTARRFVASYYALLKAISENPNLPLYKYSAMDDREKRRLLVEWNDTRTDYPQDQCVHELFEEQVRKTPDATAVVCEAESLSYGLLNRRANQLAHYLRQLGAGPDARVAICVERSLEMIVALLAVLKAGSAYVPLDPAYPPERLRFMLDDSAPVVLLTQVQVQEVLGELAKGLPVVDLADAAVCKDQPERNLEKAALGLNARHLAYVIYTSGSTGTPKGIMVEHRSMVNRLLWMQTAYELQPGEPVLQKTPFTFDVSVWEFFWPLLTGGLLVVARPGGHKDAAYLTEVIPQNNVTTAHFVPSMLQAFLGHTEVERASTLVRVVCSGEALSSTLVQRFHERFPAATLHNLYGPTEAAVDVTAWTCIREMPIARVPIGKPIANTRAYILDAHGEPVPVGVTGELYIGGVQVARGYLNRPELTAEKFLHDPFVEEPGARMYRTGDLVRWLVDGNIEYLERNDFQVKVRGFRIELGEIETRLAEHPAVREAVVVAREDTPGDKRLVAYYAVAASEATAAGEHPELAVTAEQLRWHLSASLPEYMVPAAYVRLAEMPLTFNGKLDRKALPAPDTDAFSTHGFEAPQGETETRMAAIWSELLKLDRVGRYDDFFSLGGHSLLAITLIDRLRQNGFTLDVRSLFATPTLAQLAATLETAAPAVEIPPNRLPFGSDKITPEMLPLVDLSQKEIDEIIRTVPGGAANVQDIYPLAPLQEGILFHHQMGGEGDPYLLASQLSFDTRTRMDAYLIALQAVVERHDILRTAVLWEGLAEPVQVVWRKTVLPLEEIALDSQAGDVAEQLYARFDPRRYRIDVRRAPLLRIVVCCDAANQRWLMMLLVHHLMDDNTSLRIMSSEIKAYLSGQQASLPTPLPFRNLVAQARLGISQQEHEAFFRRMLGDVDEPTLPFGLGDVTGDGTGIEEARMILDRAFSRRLREQARRMGVSVATLCHLAWAQLLAKVSGREDVVFGTVLFGRMQGGEGAGYGIGMFINTLPVRMRVGDESVEAALRRTHSLLADLMRHEHASLALAQRCSAVPALAPLFSALLNYRHIAGARPAGMEETVQALDGLRWLRGEERTNYPLMLSVDDLDEDFELNAQTLTSVGAQRICHYMRTALESLVKALETAPNTATRRLALLPEAERRQLLNECSGTRADYPQGKCIHDLFAEQVVLHGGETAVVCGQQRLTYQQLYDRSRELALYLQSRGVGPEHLVGVCMERSLNMVVGLLGILQAGGAYVPLDPDYPQERLAHMLQDSGAVMVLTEEKLRSKLGALLTGDTRLVAPVALVALDQQWAEIEDCVAGLKANQVELREQVRADDLAYVIYTSGSTGKPKGVAIEHHSPVTLVYWSRDVYRPEEWAGVLAGTSICFDLSVFEIFGTLCNGGKVILVPNALGLVNLADKESVTLINTVPSAMEELVRLEAVPSSVQTVNLAGEPLSPALVDRIYEHTSAKRVYDLYGPSESTTYSTYALREPAAAASIGRPVTNTQVYILDAHQNLQPIGVAGELHIAGDGLARGYLHRAELTQEKFVANPFQAGTRMYRTGDLARWQADGRLQYLGRIDTQVKIRGFRIEMGEIESRLNQHAGIKDSAVVAQGQQGDRKLIAFYRAHETTAGNIVQLVNEELRGHLLRVLPEHMVPTAFVSLAAIPLNPNGKVDRRALERMDVTLASSQKYVAPRNQMERQLAEIWAQLLNLPADKIGVDDDFFELGGHSLSAVQLMAKMNRQFQRLLPLEAIFSAPTIAALARLVLSDETQSMDILVPLQANGDALPIFAVPAAGGSVLALHPLSRSLGAKQPFYGLQAIGLDGKTPPLSSVEDTAGANIVAMKTAQPRGPYRLLGVSYGGVVAFEMARQLLEQEEDVASLTLLDSMPPSLMEKVAPTHTDTDFFEACLALANLYDARINTDLERLRRSSVDENVEYFVRLLHNSGIEINAVQFAALHRVYKANLFCCRAYKPAILPRNVRVSLYRATQGHEHGPALSRDYDWNPLLQNPIQIHDVEATHFSIIEHVRLQLES